MNLGGDDVKLLGSPSIPTKSKTPQGELISSRTYDLAVQWNCVQCLKLMVFDTTAANTGKNCICFLIFKPKAL